MVLCKIFDVFYFASSIEAKVCSVKGDRSTEQRFCDGQYIGGTFWFFFTFASVIVLGHHCICKHTSCAAGGLQPAELIMWVIDICLSAWMCVVKRFSICYCATHMHSAYMPWQDVCLSVCLSHAGIVPKRLNISSKFFHHRVAHHSSFSIPNGVAIFRREPPLQGRRMQGVW